LIRKPPQNFWLFMPDGEKEVKFSRWQFLEREEAVSNWEMPAVSPAGIACNVLNTQFLTTS
jgi:hypothetical protein